MSFTKFLESESQLYESAKGQDVVKDVVGWLVPFFFPKVGS